MKGSAHHPAHYSIHTCYKFPKKSWEQLHPSYHLILNILHNSIFSNGFKIGAMGCNYSPLLMSFLANGHVLLGLSFPICALLN